MTATAGKECARVLAQIQSYLDGELNEVECGAIERHCAECGPCAALVRGLRQTVGLCREVGRAPLPRSISDRARTQMKRLLSSSRISSERGE